MVEALLLLAVFAGCLLAFASLALSQQRQWETAFNRRAPSTKYLLCFKGAGALLLVVALGFAQLRDGPSFGTMLWLCMISVAALTVTFALAWMRSKPGV